MPVLTHLMLRQMSQATAIEILSNCPNIEVLVRMTYRGFGAQDRVSVDDARFVSMSITSQEYATTDWLAGTRGGVDFWVRAERFVVKKRRGEIQPSLRCWIEDGDGI
ncbi:hypothetical protein FB451DRAFT_1552910 [Mycena latifolia]|nr:hypothetical protein FB451DRAFT_1552910 [Mycena latifolia]